MSYWLFSNIIEDFGFGIQNNSVSGENMIFLRMNFLKTNWIFGNFDGLQQAQLKRV